MIKAYAWVLGRQMGLSFVKPVDMPDGAELHELQSVSTESNSAPVVLLMEAHGRKPVPVMADDEKSIAFYASSGYTAAPLVRAE